MKIRLLIATLVATATPSVALAATTDTATISGPTAVHVGAPATYTGGPACTVTCGQTFSVYGPGYSRLGTPFASGSTGTITFSRTGVFQVVYTISERCVGSPNTWCKSSATLYVGVTA